MSRSLRTPWLSSLLLAGLLSTTVGCATMQTRMGAQNSYKEGMAQLDDGDAAAAEASFEAGLAYESTSAEANAHLYAGLAEAYIRQYRLEAASEAAEKAVALESDSTTLIALSQAKLMNRDSQAAFDAAKGAVEHCNVISASNPDLAKRCYSEGFLALGRVVRAVGQYDYAIEQFDAAGANGAKPSLVLAEKAQVFNLKGEHAKGMALAVEALEKDPNSEAGKLAKGTAEAIEGDATSARTTLEPILAKNPVATLEFLRIARKFVDSGEFDRAKEMYEMVSAVQTNNSYLWMDLGYVYQQTGDKKRSAEAYEKVLKSHPDLAALAKTPDSDAFKAKLDAGLADGTIGDEQIEFITVAYTNLGNARYALADKASARDAYSRVLIADPTDLTVVLVLAGLLDADEDQDELRAVLESASTQAKAAQDAVLADDSLDGAAKKEKVLKLKSLEADIEKRLGVLLYNAGEHAAAQPHLARAVELAPDDANIQLGLGLVLFNDEKFEEAIPHLEKALADKPDDHGIQLSLGVSYRRTGNHKKAVELLEKAKTKDPRNKDIYLELHHAYKALGKTKAAREHQQMYNSLP